MELSIEHFLIAQLHWLVECGSKIRVSPLFSKGMTFSLLYYALCRKIGDRIAKQEGFCGAKLFAEI